MPGTSAALRESVDLDSSNYLACRFWPSALSSVYTTLEPPKEVVINRTALKTFIGYPSMFHDLGLTSRYDKSQLRFEVDGANAARDFLRSNSISESDIETVWNAVALHTTPGIPEFMRPYPIR